MYMYGYPLQPQKYILLKISAYRQNMSKDFLMKWMFDRVTVTIIKRMKTSLIIVHLQRYTFQVL